MNLDFYSTKVGVPIRVIKQTANSAYRGMVPHTKVVALALPCATQLVLHFR